MVGFDIMIIRQLFAGGHNIINILFNLWHATSSVR